MTVPSILVVDDDASVGRAILRLVESLDMHCTLCSSGNDMLAMVGDLRPTFVLLDIHMPGTSGMEALRELRARGHDVPAVMMTGVERDGTRDTCMAMGAIDVLPKPVDAATIEMLVARLAGT